MYSMYSYEQPQSYPSRRARCFPTSICQVLYYCPPETPHGGSMMRRRRRRRAAQAAGKAMEDATHVADTLALLPTQAKPGLLPDRGVWRRATVFQKSGDARGRTQVLGVGSKAALANTTHKVIGPIRLIFRRVSSDQFLSPTPPCSLTPCRTPEGPCGH
jgi:hypothetical protein